MLNSKFEQVSEFIVLSFKMFYYFEGHTNEECIARFDKYEDLEDLLRKVLLEIDNFYIRDQFMDGLTELLCHQTNHELRQFIEFKKKVLNILIFNISKDLQISPTRSYKFFDCLVKLLHSTKNEILVKMGIDFEYVLQMNIDVIINKESTEKSTNDYDTILCGCIKVVKVILQQFPGYKQSYGQKLLGFLLKDCLFEVPSTNVSRKKVRPPKCKNNVTRNEVFRLINVLARDCLENLDIVLSYIRGLQDNSSWRSRKQQDWFISPHHDEKSITGYVGIKNLGCICYMISLFQQLYMIPSFRESILAIDDPKKEESPPEDNILYQLQCIFAFLHQSEQQFYNPQGFTNAFKDWDGNPTNVLIQMDVDEFFNMFMDRLEGCIKGSEQEKMIQEHFGRYLCKRTNL